MRNPQRKPTYKVVKQCYDFVARFEKLGAEQNGAVRSASDTLLPDGHL